MGLGPEVAGVAIAGLGTALTVPVLVPWLRRRARIDLPGPRSLHAVPTPRGGGVAPVTWTVVALLVSGALSGQDLAVVVGFVLLLAAIGLGDDFLSLGAVPRLAGQAVGAVAAVAGLQLWEHGGVLGVLVGAVWLVGFTNAFNFMDGVNGLAASQAVIAGVCWAAVGAQQGASGFAWAGAIVAAAALAFLPANFPAAKVFLGDVGSYGVGSALAILVLVGLRASIPLVAVVAPLAVFVTDTGLTMLRRARRGERLLEAHRDHVFQQLAAAGWSHVRITLTVDALVIGCSALGALALASGAGQALAIAGVVLLLAVYVSLPSLTSRRRRPGSTPG